VACPTISTTAHREKFVLYCPQHTCTHMHTHTHTHTPGTEVISAITPLLYKIDLFYLFYSTSTSVLFYSILPFLFYKNWFLNSFMTQDPQIERLRLVPLQDDRRIETFIATFLFF
jgi:hypothetical protein